MSELQRVVDGAHRPRVTGGRAATTATSRALVPKTCPQCAAPYLEHVGFGTERVEREIAELFPDARVGRVDRDTIRKRGSLASVAQSLRAARARRARRHADDRQGA